MDNDEIVTFDKFEDEAEANIVKGVLCANGVNAGVLGDSTANALLHFTGRGTYRVVVMRSDLERAQAIIDSLPDADAEDMLPPEFKGDDTTQPSEQ